MKKSIKRTAAAVLAVATTAGIASTTSLSLTKTSLNNNSSSVFAEPSVLAERNTLNISKYKKVVSLYGRFELPTVEFVNDAGTTTAITQFKVTTPIGETFDQNDARITSNGFDVDSIGTYTIAYEQGDYKGEVTFEVETSNYSVSLRENTSNLLPKKVAIKNEDGTAFTKVFNVPTFEVIDENGDVVDQNNLIVEIKLTKPDFSTVDISSTKTVVFDDTNAIQEGNYIVTYKVYSKKGEEKGEYLCETSTEFRAVTEDVYNNKYDLTLVYGSELPTTVNIGKTVELPTITAKNGSEVVPTFFTVKVYKNKGEQRTLINETDVIEGTDKKIITKNDKGVYEFTADEIGAYYRVEYTVEDALGNKKETQFNITNVVDTENPTPLVVDAYTVQDGKVVDADKVVDKAYDLKSMFGTEDVVIKAIYGQDLGTFNYSGFTFERKIENSSGQVVYSNNNKEDAGKNLVFNHSETAPELDSTKNIVVDKKLSDGYYYVYYIVTDANGKTAQVGYKFTIQSNFDWTDSTTLKEIKPTVTFNDTFYSSVDLGEKIEFSKVTFTDEKDERLDTSVYYTYTVGGVEGDKQTLELDSNDKYTINTKQAPTNAEKVTIYAKAINDGGKETIEKREIVLKSEILGTSVPKIVEIDDAGYSYSYVQNKIITIPTMKFTDGTDSVDSLNARVSIKCTDADGNVTDVPANDPCSFKVGGYFIYSNTKFVASKAGEYLVSVRVTDAAGNTTIKFLKYTVTDAGYAGNLRFANLPNDELETISLGDKYKLYAATITGTNSDKYDYYVMCTKAAGDYELSNSEFRPLAIGEYEIKYVMYNKSNINDIVTDQSITLKFNVKDEVGPEINVNWETEAVKAPNATETDKTKQSILPAYEKGTTILIPKFSASDLSGIDVEKSMIEIKTTSGSKYSTSTKIKYKDMVEKYNRGLAGETNQTMFYTFDYDAEYNIIYTAYDKNGNATTKTFSIKIGDLIPPTLTVKDEIVNTTYKAGQTLTIDLADTKNYITVKDNKDGISKNDVKVKLTLNGTVIKNTNTGDDSETKYIFNLEDAGEYSLEFTVTDEAGWSTTVTKTFSIQDSSKEAKTSTEIIGTVLIVASVVVLAGVIVYFIISKKKMDKLYKG